MQCVCRLIAPVKPTKVTFFTMILYNSENSIRDIRPFCSQLLCHSSLWDLLHLSYSREPVMTLDYQILLKSPPLTLLAGSYRGWQKQLLRSQCVSFMFAWGYCRLLFKNFCILCSVLITASGLSQPSSNVAREVQISRGPQCYLVLFRMS